MSKPPEPEDARGPASLPAQGLRWFGCQLAKLLTATVLAVAAIASFVWALSPWLVFVALATGVVAVVSADARGWLTMQAMRTWAVVAKEDAGPPGFLYLEAPQVYTRERLVNDRFTQANWLRRQLDRTEQESFVESFASPSYVSDEIGRLSLSLGRDGRRNSDRRIARGGENDEAQTSTPNDVLLERLDLFEKVNVYRSALRNELMNVQLDDGHDLDGNTLYRLNFNAVVQPFMDRPRYPGTAVFLITARKPDDDKTTKNDNEELLTEWQREMQAFLTRVLEQREEDFERNGALENPTDPKEDLALDWFMRTRLVEKLLDYLNDLPGEAAPYLDAKCAKAAGEPEMAREQTRDCRINELADLAGFEYRTEKPTPDMSLAQEAGFRRAIERANLVNIAQWPKAGPGSYNQTCVDKVQNSSKGGGKDPPSEATEPPGDAEGQRLEANTATSPDPERLVLTLTVAGESSGAAAAPQADLPDVALADLRPAGDTRHAGVETTDAKVAAGSATPVRLSSDEVAAQSHANANSSAAKDEKKPNNKEKIREGPQSIEAILADRCLVPFNDPYRLRALARLLSVVEDLQSYSRTTKGKDAGASNESEPTGEDKVLTDKNKAQKAIAGILKELNTVLPKMGVAPTDRSETGASQFTIKALKDEIDEFSKDNRKLSELTETCEPLLELAKGIQLNDAIRVGAIQYARCRFLFAPVTNVRGLLAEFIVARVDGDLGGYYGAPDPALNEFLTVTTDGCVLTSCRIRVDMNKNNEQVLANKLVETLDERSSGLSIYEISPRSVTIVRRDGGGADVSVELGGVWASASGGVSRRDQSAHAVASVMGFGQVPEKTEKNKENGSNAAVFGWTVRPQRDPVGNWSQSHHRLSAVISVPSWWKRLDLDLHACWVTPQVARDHGEALFTKPEKICETVYGKKPSQTKTGEDETGATGTIGHSMRPVRVQLPRSVEEVTARFNFDLVKTPYFDPTWKGNNSNDRNPLMVGRPAHIALAGERLWRSTVVTIDGLPANRITVLPDMKGVIAEFECLRLSSDASPEVTDHPPAMLTVWTAEGRTTQMSIPVRPFKAVKGTDETPCYINQTNEAGRTRAARATKVGD